MKLQPLLVRISLREKIIGSKQDVIGIEARVEVLRLLKAANHQARENQQQQRESDLRDGQSAAQANLSSAHGGASAFFLDGACRTDSGSAQGREQAEHHAGDNGNG